MRASPVGTRRCTAGEDGGPEGTGPPPPYRGGRSPGAPSRKRSTRAQLAPRCKGRRRAVGPEPLQRGASCATAPTAAPQGLAGASARPRRAGQRTAAAGGRRPHRERWGRLCGPCGWARATNRHRGPLRCRGSRPPAASRAGATRAAASLCRGGRDTYRRARRAATAMSRRIAGQGRLLVAAPGV